ncbi:hypothetical protein LT493_15205 [Streptomyces tricolor]|nr:hypothetical protein [Streptomyces tricolor]
MLALLAAPSNAAASVLQRRAAVQEPERAGTAGSPACAGTPGCCGAPPGWRAPECWRCPACSRPGRWPWAACRWSSRCSPPSCCSRWPWAVSSFRRRPDGRTWLAFVAPAGGLALFLPGGLAVPSAGPPRRRRTGCSAAAGRSAPSSCSWSSHAPPGAPPGPRCSVSPPPCAFALTAALLKEAAGGSGRAPRRCSGHWALYATGPPGSSPSCCCKARSARAR